MKSFTFSLRIVLTLFAVSVLLLPGSLLGQSLTSGDVTGTVLDPSGAAVPDATVTLKNNDTGSTQTTTTTSTGAYRFRLLNPGSYSVSAAATGFQGKAQNVSVAVGQTSTVNMQMQLASASQTVEVTAQAGVIQTDNGNVSTTISPEIVSSMPIPATILPITCKPLPVPP